MADGNYRILLEEIIKYLDSANLLNQLSAAIHDFKQQMTTSEKHVFTFPIEIDFHKLNDVAGM